MATGNILVTGFGPFGDHKINASWESVKLLPDNIEGFTVIKEEIPVSYDVVDEKVKALWMKYNPELVVHVGVSSFTDKLTLEKCAYKQGYIKKDVYGNCPQKGGECTAESRESCIEVGLNVVDICNQLNSLNMIKACVSDNAGRYLCEYTLYTSLSLDNNRALFIHVPPLHKPYSAHELAQGILQIIKCAIEQRK